MNPLYYSIVCIDETDQLSLKKNTLESQTFQDHSTFLDSIYVNRT
jgi:hypothetical protein